MTLWTAAPQGNDTALAGGDVEIETYQYGTGRCNVSGNQEPIEGWEFESRRWAPKMKCIFE
jgi:hypothetical protein